MIPPCDRPKLTRELSLIEAVNWCFSFTLLHSRTERSEKSFETTSPPVEVKFDGSIHTPKSLLAHVRACDHLT